MRTRSAFAPALLATFFAAMPCLALAVDDDANPPVSAEHAAGKKAITAKDWNGAIQALTAAARRDGGNADIQNMLGYAYRNSGQLEAAFKHYHLALKLDPRHLGAHEYIGEAYLLANNPAKAEEHLARLRQLCPSACEEYDDLRKKLDQYRVRAK